MHFRHRQTDRQTDTGIIAQARDVYITSRAKNYTRPNFHQICVHVAYGPGSVLALCTSGFVDDVMFSHIGPVARHVYSYAALEYDTRITVDISTKFWSPTKPSNYSS